MFTKNYDKEISDLYKKISEIIEMQGKNQDTLLEMIKETQKIINSFEGVLLDIAKVQKSHKEAIMLLGKR